MHIVIAPDSFKGSLTATAVVDAIALGIMDVLYGSSIVKKPMADGGEGTTETIVASQSGQMFATDLVGPLGSHQSINASFGIITMDQKKIAIVELAHAAGLALVPLEKRNPLYTTTFGFGQLIASALDHDVDKLIIALGGSGTNDCGCGMLQALGVQFKDGFGDDIVGEMTAALLSQVSSIDISKIDHRLAQIEIEICCDVNNPLLGDVGASKVYGPQKGASAQIVMQLEQNMNHIIDIIETMTGRSVRDMPGSGAAGGVAAALLGFTQARLMPGSALVMQLIDLEDAIAKTDIVITGEGQLDATSKMGKVVASIAKLAKKYKKPVIAIVGQNKATEQEIAHMGIAKVITLVSDTVTEAQAQANPAQYIQAAIAKVDFSQI
jgi:glycerate kinase